MQIVLDLARYSLGSAAALAVDYSLLIVLTELMGLHYMASAAVGFSAGLIAAYALSVVFVFKRRRLDRPFLEFAAFAAIGVLGLGLNQALLWGIVTYLDVTYVLAKLPTTSVVFLFNFAMRRTLLFSSTR
ncbi:hypothetical protein AA309_13190 [Microvirga vignae]|uniref:GtrA/DPMS transmembrane domain-containing protein n=1 Tax=Microvirga vignae TaxID=1225564 RepID=A0A0H1RCG3_9HYPH|nr:GtrA family protein [Microvirga vignae]KLK92779.1 hypothetical protein AA309_13190 [Microvirga vignae]